MKHKSTGKQIAAVETTTDKITGRGGITFILRYLEKSKIFNPKLSDFITKKEPLE